MKPLYSLFTLLPWILPPSGELALALLTAHLIGDFVFQTSPMSTANRRLTTRLAHAVVYGLLAYVLAGQWALWTLPLAISLIHGSIDCARASFNRERAAVFLLDQVAHLIAIFVLVSVYGKFIGPAWWSRAFGPVVWQVMAVAVGAILSVRVTSVLIGYWVQPYLDELKKISAGSPKTEAGRGLTNGGRVIGQWERAMIFLLVFIGQTGAVGFLVAAKSVFRFGELMDRNNRMEAEYITVGTLMSFGMAIVWSLATLFVYHRLR